MSIVDNPPLFIALNATLFLLAYFIPTFVALTRQRDQRRKLFLVNLLTGWTIIGWMAVFIWAIALPSEYDRTPRPLRRPD
ncbi:MAG: superinfection immunity protein [Alkalilacustris sp.]